MKKAECVLVPNCILAEGCVWNRNEDALYFVDIEGCRIYRWNPLQEEMGTIHTSQMTGCLVFHKNGGIVTAEKNRLIYRKTSPDMQVLAEQRFPDYLRYNDGKCDRYGNLWVGTMAASQSHPLAKEGGSLYCIRDGKVVSEYGGYTIPNGMAWSRDGSVFYHIDTALQRVDAYDVEEEIRLVNRRTVLTVPEEEGSPDGMCMDADGNLWIAMWGGSRVNGYRLRSDERADRSAAGETGGRMGAEKIEEIRVPDRYVSCCSFGGRDGRSLYITTARDEEGSGGQIYRADMEISGAEVYEYGGEGHDGEVYGGEGHGEEQYGT